MHKWNLKCVASKCIAEGCLVGLDGMLRKVPGARPAMWWMFHGSASSAFLFPGLQGAGEACPYSLAPCSELAWAPAEEKNTWPGEALRT